MEEINKHKFEQGKLDFVPKQKSYSEYTEEEKKRLVRNILEKRRGENKEPFSPEELAYIEAEEEYFKDDSQPSYGK